MYVILVYDVGEQRVAKMPPILRKYLKHVQRSVFEGNITPADMERMKKEIVTVIDKDSDTVRMYIFRSEEAMKTEVIGVDTLPTNIF